MNRHELSGRRRRSHALVALLIACLALMLPAVTSAHVEILGTGPSKTAKTSLKQVTVTLSGPIRSGSLKVFGPGGEQVSKGAGGRDPGNYSALLATLKGGLAPGRYAAKAVWVSADGHRQSSTFHFRLTR